MSNQPLGRRDVIAQRLDIGKADRAGLKNQKPLCIWLTGLSGSGKSTLANRLESRLHAEGRHTYLIDGDNLRHGLNRDLGFDDASRVENVRRAAECARILVDAGLIVIVALISPFTADRAMARALFEPGEFVEVFVDTPIEVCEARDPKGLYKRARAGQIANFTGLTAPYEAPPSPELRVRGADVPAEQTADVVYRAVAAMAKIASV